MACCCELQNTLDVDVTQDALLDVEIGGSAGVLLQGKSVEITENGTSVVAPDDGFDGLKSVEINTNVPKRFECGDAYLAPPASGATSISINRQLKTLNTSCWDTSKVTSMNNMFSGCSSLQSIDVSRWDTSKVTNIIYMFRGCSSLQSLDVSRWDTSNVVISDNVFDSCKSIQSLDLSNWNFSRCERLIGMFNYCYSLRTLIGDKTIEDVENGTVVLKGVKVNVSTVYASINKSEIRFSSILALANGLADLTGATAQTLTISKQSYNNMYNDDDTKPTAEVIAERQARIAAICAAKNWNFAH